MFEKPLVGTIIILLVIGIVFQMNESHFAFGLLFLATCLCCFLLCRTLFTINNRLSFLTKAKYVSSRQLINFAATKVNQQDEMVKLVIHEIEKIGDGNPTILSEKIESNAATALVRLKEKLESYKKEEAIRNWAVEGIAFLSDVRKSIINIDDFASQIIAYLTKYLGANQGAFYILRGEDGEDRVLELTASYAYEKRRYSDKQITIHSENGLLGQCIQEKDIIFLPKVPKDYIRITSGLGESTPTCIMIAPLIFGDRVYGIIEIASFQILEDYHLDFSRKACVNIAAELSAMLIHENTERLLQQTIQAQEEMKMKEQQISAKLLEVEAERSKNIAILNGCMDGVISFDERGVIGFANAAAEEIFNRSQQVLLGSDIRDLMEVTIVQNRQGENSIFSTSGNEITLRTEVTSKDHELSLLLTSTKVKVEEGYLFTLFIQKISVDLF